MGIHYLDCNSQGITLYYFANCSKMTKDSNLVWVDCEMTGLDINTDHLLEIAVVITDKDLNILAEGPNLVIHQTDEILDLMGEWCVNQHGKSGLTEKVKKSTTSLKDCENQVLDFIQQWTTKGMCPLAGNVVGTDKKFIEKYMPKVMEHLNFRIVDVESVAILAKQWYPKEYDEKPEKGETHRALDDILESIEEMKYYEKAIFKKRMSS